MARLFDEGQFQEAVQLYDAHARKSGIPIGAVFLRARCYLREPNGEHKAVVLLNKLSLRDGDEDAIRRDTLLGAAYAAAGDLRASDSKFKAALAGARAIGDRELLAEVAYRVGRRYAVWASDLDEARKYLQFIRSGKSLQSQLDALQLEAAILSRETRVREEARVLTELLLSLNPQSNDHMENRAWSLHTLSALARETYLPDALPLIERYLATASWPPDFAVLRFQTTKALAWAKALQGDYFNAFRFLKQTALSAPDDAWRTMVLCDRAYLARVRGEDTWSRQELSDAEEAAEHTEWEQREDESTVALLLLAELVAPINAAQASGYLARFRKLGGIKERRLLMKGDERFQALIDYSTGVVEVSLGDRRLAMEALKSALSIYERSGFEWRAARAALRLYDATNKISYLERASSLLRHYSNSWLADELRARKGGNSGATGLSPMRDKVFRLLCDGKSNAEIASQLGLAVSTVANHAKAVLKAFSVTSRHALIAEAIRRGVISS